jgi:hypothetical protein
MDANLEFPQPIVMTPSRDTAEYFVYRTLCRYAKQWWALCRASVKRPSLAPFDLSSLSRVVAGSAVYQEDIDPAYSIDRRVMIGR